MNSSDDSEGKLIVSVTLLIIIAIGYFVGSCSAQTRTGTGTVIEKHYSPPGYRQSEKFVLVIRSSKTEKIETVEATKELYFEVRIGATVEYWIKQGPAGHVYGQGISAMSNE